MEKVLTIVTSQELRNELRRALADRYEVLEAAEPSQSMDLLSAHLPKVVLLDLELGDSSAGYCEGLRYLDLLTRTGTTGCKVVALTGQRRGETGLKAVERGAYDFYRKPVAPVELRNMVERAFHLCHVEERMARLQETLDRSTAMIEGIAGECSALKKAFAAVQCFKQQGLPEAQGSGISYDGVAGPATETAPAEYSAYELVGSIRLPLLRGLSAAVSEVVTLREARDRVEKGLISATVDSCGGNMVKAAELLAISRPALYDLMKKHGIFKPGVRH